LLLFNLQGTGGQKHRLGPRPIRDMIWPLHILALRLGSEI
jgi:hypothetical protein